MSGVVSLVIWVGQLVTKTWLSGREGLFEVVPSVRFSLGPVDGFGMCFSAWPVGILIGVTGTDWLVPSARMLYARSHIGVGSSQGKS